MAACCLARRAADSGLELVCLVYGVAVWYGVLKPCEGFVVPCIKLQLKTEVIPIIVPESSSSQGSFA
jgi:hypothetical protein